MSLRASEDCGSAASRNDEVRPAHIEALLDPAAHESPGVKPELVETHISWLIFTDEYVYKVKKPVDFGFLDFSTLEKRKHFCSEELRLNQRLSPGVYLGVESIHRAPDGPAQSHGTPGRPPFTLGGEGPVVDYAVKMRRLPDSGWLSGLLERNEVEASLTKRVARRIAHFHEGTPPADVASPGASLDIVVQNTEENFEQTADFVGWSLPPSATNVVQAYTRATLEACRTLFLRREQEGHVRDCHGDLHAGQICVENGIDFIDCIEFNERFRVSDTAADLAFLSMDLEARGHPELSRVLVDAYQNERKDPTLRSVLRFYECYRAFTRGKVESLRAMQLARGSPAQDEAVDAARRYFELARSYATPRGPLLLTLTGLMGTGKSTVARFLGGAWDATVIRSDEVRKDLTGVPEDEHRYSAWKGDIYSDEVTEATYAEMHRRAIRRPGPG